MAEQPETILEEREELLISPKGGKPTLKIGHFIKPIFNLSDLTPILPSISLPFRPISVDCTFNGWKYPTKSWISWVDRLHSSYQFIWRRAGIYEAILSSRYKIVKNKDLFFGLAERWCCDTNTFVFPWGEATITLEDVMVLGGYSVLGDSVSGSVNTDQFDVVNNKLIEAHQEMSRGSLQKAKQGHWIKHFMELGGDSGIEHEAFLSYWLSRFVLPTFPYDVIVKKFFKIAIVLAGGVQISFAPVVLASIYRDLSLLKSAMGNFGGTATQGCDKDDGFDDLVKVTVWAPLHLVQVWAWERFPEFRPNPSLIEFGEPRLARWHGVNEDEIGNVRPLLQSAGNSFEWRPYCKIVDSLPLPCFYREAEEWVIIDDVLVDDVKSMVRFMRVCHLVGMDSIEQYNPNRVAMQFGFDQDVPEYVKRGLMDSDIPRREVVQLAWFSYINPIRDEILYVPSRVYEPQVTLRYLKWLRQGVLTKQAAMDGVVRKKRSIKRRSRTSQEHNNVIDDGIAFLDIDVKPSFETKAIGSDLDVPPGFTPKTVGNNKVDVDQVADFTPKNNAGQVLDVPPGFMPKPMGNNPSSFSQKSCGFSPEVVVKKEPIESTENRQKALLRCGYETLNNSAAEIGSIKTRGSSGKSEFGEIVENLGDGREDHMNLLAHIQQLEKTIAELSKGRSETIFSFV
ncbi:hypothetical protein SOVF_179650 [Spinacia oleracea]|nr:hypothetical protein SOVF_179650 [Spinacia oleracea]